MDRAYTLLIMMRLILPMISTFPLSLSNFFVSLATAKHLACAKSAASVRYVSYVWRRVGA